MEGKKICRPFHWPSKLFIFSLSSSCVCNIMISQKRSGEQQAFAVDDDRNMHQLPVMEHDDSTTKKQKLDMPEQQKLEGTKWHVTKLIKGGQGMLRLQNATETLATCKPYFSIFLYF